MKNKMLVFLLIFCFVGMLSNEAYAQRKKKRSTTTDEYFDESGGFKHRLWYGGNLSLNYSGNAFNIGISPMVGYKILEPLSVGPRFKIDYYWERLQTFSGTNVDFKSTSYGFGAFTRAKFLQTFFGHVEFEYENSEVADRVNGQIVADPNDASAILTTREGRNNFYIGAGYNSGGEIGYEIMILYNLNHPKDSNLLPIDFRVGFTYKF